MAKYDLKYFNVTGLGEPIRYVFAYCKIPFEDTRFGDMVEFEKYKPLAPFGKVPVVEFEGKKLHQSAAICRYFAKQAGIAGKSDWDQLQADMAVDTFTDFRQHFKVWFHEKDEKVKSAVLEDIKANHAPYYLSRFDKQVEENRGYFVNGQLTWADLYIVSVLELFLRATNEPLLANYKNLKELKEKVENLPGIKEYRDSRPDTAF